MKGATEETIDGAGGGPKGGGASGALRKAKLLRWGANALTVLRGLVPKAYKLREKRYERQPSGTLRRAWPFPKPPHWDRLTGRQRRRLMRHTERRVMRAVRREVRYRRVAG